MLSGSSEKSENREKLINNNEAEFWEKSYKLLFFFFLSLEKSQNFKI